MMNLFTTKELVVNIISEFGYGIGNAQEEERLISDLGFDSIDLMELVMALEDEFEIEVDDIEKLDNLGLARLTVGDVVKMVENKK